MDGPAPLQTTPAPSYGPGILVRYWRKVGAGSLLLSLLIHTALLVLASLVVIAAVERKPRVDFLPGGGSKTGREATNTAAQLVKQNRRKLLNKSSPLHKIVAQNASSAIALPDLPMVI